MTIVWQLRGCAPSFFAGTVPSLLSDAHRFTSFQIFRRARPLRGCLAPGESRRSHRAGRAERRRQVDALLAHPRRGVAGCGQSLAREKRDARLLPQETAAAGDESVLELACGKIAPGSWKRSTTGRSSRRRNGSSPGSLFARAISIGRRSALSGGWIMRAHLARLLVHGARSSAARRTDQPSRSRFVSLVPGISRRIIPARSS